MKKQHGPPPRDRAVLTFDLTAGRWAFCTPTPLGWDLTVHGEEERQWESLHVWPKGRVWYDLPDPTADEGGYGKLDPVPLSQVAADLRASLSPVLPEPR